MDKLVWILIGLIAGKYIGWNAAHHCVAEECRRLGSFYVGKSIFKCIEIKDPEPFVVKIPPAPPMPEWYRNKKVEDGK